MRRRERIASSADFRRLFRRGARIDGPLFLMIAAQNDRGHDRLGLAVGRRVGGAVQRNRAKRLLRESYRRNKGGAGVAMDVVLVAKPGIVGRTQEDVEREFRQRLRRLAARGSTGLRTSPPVSH